MPHIICEPCVGVRDTSCVGACPVDCISEAQATPHPPRGDEMLTIHPEESIDCGACVGA